MSVYDRLIKKYGNLNPSSPTADWLSKQLTNPDGAPPPNQTPEVQELDAPQEPEKPSLSEMLDEGMSKAAGRTDCLVKVCDAYYKLATEHKVKYSVWWRNPDKQDQWDIYQSGLSKARAEKLSKEITYFLSVRWFNKNIPTRVLPDGASI